MSTSTMVEDRYCDQCGSLLPAVARFCGLCGAPAADLSGHGEAVADRKPFPLAGKIGLALGTAVGIVSGFVQSPDPFLGPSVPAGRLALAGGVILLVSAVGLSAGWIVRSIGIGLASAAAIFWLVQAIDLALTADPTLSVTMLGAGGAIALIALGVVTFSSRRSQTRGATLPLPEAVDAESVVADSDSSSEPTLGPPPIGSPRSTIIKEPVTEEDQGAVDNAKDTETKKS